MKAVPTESAPELDAERAGVRTQLSNRYAGWRRRVMRVPMMDKIVVALVILLLLVAVFGPYFAPASATTSDIGHSLRPPSGAHWLGTDDQGRDVLWRVILGARISVLSAIAIVIGQALIAIVIASLATIGGRAVDSALMGLCDIGLAVPPMIAAIGLADVLGASLRSGIIAMIFVGWTIAARLLRLIMRQTMEMPYVKSAVVLGASKYRLMVRHVLPNAIDNLLVKWSVEVGTTIVVLASLSYIGVGAQPPSPEWGAMIANSQSYVSTAWWSVLAPGVAIIITAVAFGLLGEVVQGRLDGRIERSRSKLAADAATV